MDTPPIPTPTTSSQSSMETPPIVTETPQPQPQPQPQSQPPPQPPPQPQPQPTPQPLEPPSSSSQTQHSQPFQTPHTISSSSSPIPIPISTPNPNPNLNPNPNPIPTNFPQQPPANNNISNRPPFNRPWSQPTSQFSHFPSQFHSSSASSTSTSTSSPVVPPPQRGGIAIGVPASSVSSQPSSFSSSFGAHYVGPPASSPSPARPSIHGMPSMGMIGSQLRPGGVPPSALLQQRPVQAASGIRPQPASNSLPSASQNFQGHGMLRAPSVSASSISTPSTSQSQQSPHQPWLSAQHGRPPLPSQSIRPQVNPQSLQQRSHIPQQSPQLLQEASPPHQLLPSSQQPQQIPASNQSQDNHGQQLSSARISQPLANQHQLIRTQGSTNQKPPSPAIGQASIAPSGRPTENSNATEISEACSTILSKRNIQEIVNQIDPSEKLDPEVEDVLVDIAEEFIDSITTFGCSLAKHRKSSTLEAKDILLHIDRTWNMTLPGFSGDEIRTYKKPVVNDIHKERLALIKKSHTGAEIGTNKTSSGPATVNVKGNFTKAAANVVGS